MSADTHGQACAVDGCTETHGVESFTPDLSNPGETERRCWDHRKLLTLARARQGGCKDYPIPDVDGVEFNESDRWRVVSVEEFRALEEQGLDQEPYDGDGAGDSQPPRADWRTPTRGADASEGDDTDAESVVDSGAQADADDEPGEDDGETVVETEASASGDTQSSLGDFG